MSLPPNAVANVSANASATTASPGVQRLGRRAAVLGASIAGLLAARVLSEFFDEVLLLERDELPTGNELRKGTPQAFQPHGLLARGRAALEDLFPGLTESLVAQGALAGDVQQGLLFEVGQRRFARFGAGSSCGHMGLAVSRSALEGELRRRVLALASVRLLAGVSVQPPLLDESARRVAGVRFTPREGAGSEQVLPTDLVLDCTGRASRLPQWLQQWGYEAPNEDKLEVGISYCSAFFRRAAGTTEEAAVSFIRSATPEMPRPAVFIAQEPDAAGVARWVVGLGGYGADGVEPTLAAMQRRAAELGNAPLQRIVSGAELLGPVRRFAFPTSVRRRYERLARLPRGLLVLGDAMTSFNPIYGQGMTVAACQALALREVLSKGRAKESAKGSASGSLGRATRATAQGEESGIGAAMQRRYFKAAARVVDVPWQLALGADLALPSVPGPRPLRVRIVNAYVRLVHRAAEHDPHVALAFMKVVHLLERPQSLFAPRLLWRVLRVASAPTPAAALAPVSS